MRFVPRHLTPTLRRAVKTFPAVLVTGARQTGKTTLLRREFGKTHRFASLERPDVRERARSDPAGFFRDHRAPLILDEIQYAPELLHHVKELIDERRVAGRWLLTGSQSFGLMQGISQTLAGRVAVLTLDPLSVAETTHSRPQPVGRLLARVFSASSVRPRTARAPALGDWLLRGGYPELRTRPRVDRTIWLSSYVQTYIERDVRTLRAVGDLDSFSRFVRLAAARNGAIVNLADLARDAGVSAPTAKSWLSILTATNVVYLLRPYHRNFGKRLVKAPKLYFTDPALAAWLIGLHDPDAILHGPAIGGLLESAVVSEWIKAFHGSGLEPPLYYWRSSAGHEVDLVIDHGGVLHAVEIKKTATPRPAHAASLARFLEMAGPTTRGALACDVARPTALRPSIRAVPWHLGW